MLGIDPITPAPGAYAWIADVAAPVTLLLAAVLVVVVGVVRALSKRSRPPQLVTHESAQRSAARARFERHEESKARVRFVPSDDTTDTR